MKHPFSALALSVVLQLTIPACASSTEDLAPAAARLTQTVRGMVIAVDEDTDRIALRLPNDDSEDYRVEDLRVQDGLALDAVRAGDQVEVTVESIDGARTIVALKKE